MSITPAQILTPVLSIPNVEYPATQTQDTNELSTTSDLISGYKKCWNKNFDKYLSTPFCEKSFINLLQENEKHFKILVHEKKHHGFIEKINLLQGTKLFVRADLHGDLKSLMENLETLQSQGMLDENFKCKPDTHLIFLGDYCDRGPHTLEVLQLLVTLRLENPTQVTLTLGNHERTQTHKKFLSAEDSHFASFISDDNPQMQTNINSLNELYKTFPLTTYIAAEGEKREYVEFTHGLFELYVDPCQLLAESSSRMTQFILKKSKLSLRIRELDPKQGVDYKEELKNTIDKTERKKIKQLIAAERIKFLLFTEEPHKQDITAYTWGDVGKKTKMGRPEGRNWILSPEDVKHYLRLCSPQHPVKMIFRGHQHLKQHYTINGKAVISTMPIGMDLRDYMVKYPKQLDTAYILQIAPKVKDWTKMAILREPTKSTKEVTRAYPIQSLEI